MFTMRIIGLGVDLADVDRVRTLLARHPERFRRRIFTEHEQEYAARFADPSARLAARFAGKEAVMKSLGAGWRRIRWRDVEIRGGGKPTVRLAGTAQARAADLGVTEVLVTVTHTRTQAVVMAVAVGE
jgi:holo-[acyl-carrier protein] synthase